MKKLSKIFRGLIYILPAVLFFSYFPVISLGSSETMNFEFSLPLLWLSFFDLIALIMFFKKHDFSFFKKWRWLLFPFFVTLSLIWTDNLVRGILTCGIMWMVVFAIYSIVRFREEFYDGQNFYSVFLKFFFGSALLVSAWCVVQCVLDVAGVPREYTLLCQGCVYGAFGFPHPNGFAIEPQFMGNLLLAPTIVAAFCILFQAASPRSVATGEAHSSSFCQAPEAFKRTTKCLYVIFFMLAVTLFLTFSRGAIYAFIVAMIFMSATLLIKKVEFKKLMMVWGTIILSFLFTLNLQGILAQVSPTNDTYVSGISKVLNHLSLGIIDVRGEMGTEAVNNDVVAENEATFDGYVEESTNVRMEFTKNAIKVWSRDFRTMLFGVGIGGAGQAMYDAGLIGAPKEIVQNEYASLLLETGLIGVLILIFTFVMFLKNIRKNPISIIILTLGVAYGVSLLFFSGFANALQIYLLLPVIYIVFLKKFVS